MNARKGVHVQKSYTFQTFVHESSMVGGRGKRETGKTELGQKADGKKGSPKKQELT